MSGRVPDHSLRRGALLRKIRYLCTNIHKNTSTTSAKISAIGLAPTPSQAAPWKATTPGFVVFIVELPPRLTILEAPPFKAVIVDVGVVVRREVSV